LVRDIVTAHVLDPIHLKGISREIVPYAIDGRRDENGTIAQPIRVHHEGPERRLDVAKGDPSNAVSIKSSFRKTLEALESRRVTGDSA
jgi:adenylate cyclase